MTNSGKNSPSTREDKEDRGQAMNMKTSTLKTFSSLSLGAMLSMGETSSLMVKGSGLEGSSNITIIINNKDTISKALLI